LGATAGSKRVVMLYLAANVRTALLLRLGSKTKNEGNSKLRQNIKS
jgi:hypothetical protein